MEKIDNVVRAYIQEFYEDEDPGEFQFDLSDVRFLMKKMAENAIDECVSTIDESYEDNPSLVLERINELKESILLKCFSFSTIRHTHS